MNQRAIVWLFVLGCGCVDSRSSGGSDGTESSTSMDNSGDLPEAPALELRVSQVKRFDFEWAPAEGAEFYQLLERATEGEPYVEVGEDIVDLSTSLIVPLYDRFDASYRLRACNAEGCTDSEAVDVGGRLEQAIGFVKPSTTMPPPDSGDNFHFGSSVAISADGRTLAVGAPAEHSIHGLYTGAVHVFARDAGGQWVEQAIVEADAPIEFEQFGASIALSDDGDTLALGTWENTAYVFERDDQAQWSQQVQLARPHGFGTYLTLSSDGDTLAVGAYADRSNATGIDGDPDDTSAPFSGATYVFVRDDEVHWVEQAYIKAANAEAYDFFGISVALSSDGDTLAVGAFSEDGGATGVGGNPGDNSAKNCGAAYVFVRDPSDVWSQQAYVKPTIVAESNNFGDKVALSSDGDTLVVNAIDEGLLEPGDEDNYGAGAVHVYERDAQAAWSHVAHLTAPEAEAGDRFGAIIALSGDAHTLAISASRVSSTGTGVGVEISPDTPASTGAVHLFERSDQGPWSQRAYLKPPIAITWQGFTASLALSSDARTLAVGSSSDPSGLTGVGAGLAEQADQSADQSGAVYLY